MRDPRWTGIHKHGAGWRATVKQGRAGKPIQRHFAADTDVKVMQQWRADTKAGLQLSRKQRALAGTLAADATLYKDAVRAMTTYEERCDQIDFWVAELGTMRRDEITPGRIRAIRDRLLIEPRSKTDHRPLAPGTVNKYLRALSNLYTVLDGDRLPNPVRRVPEAAEPDPEPRAQPYATIEKILAAIPDAGCGWTREIVNGKAVYRGQPRGSVSKTKIRLRCFAYCQITPAQMRKLDKQDGDVDLEHGRVRLDSRKKGKGAKGIWTPLVPKAIQAFTDFHQHDCYGGFSQSSLRKSFKSAARRAGITAKIRAYDLRHSFGTQLYRLTGNLEGVGKLFQHGLKKTTERYAMAADQHVLDSFIAAVAPQFGTTDTGQGQDRPENSGPVRTTRTPLPTHSRGGPRSKSVGKRREKVGGR